MSSNSIGKNLVFTSFGESHGPFVGGVLDGMPPGLLLDFEALNRQMQRRKPGQNTYTTSRSETDQVAIISGVFQETTLGTPIALLIENKDSNPADYENLKDTYRPGHADALWDLKMGFRDHRGGGRSSARITAAWVAAGALAEQFLNKYDKVPIEITAWVQQIHHIKAANIDFTSRAEIDQSPVRCPDLSASQIMEEAILQAKNEGNSLGGIIRCRITGVPAGKGEPVFRKLQAQLAHYIMNLNAVKGIYFGIDNLTHERTGAENNDPWIYAGGSLRTSSNFAGGIIGGMSTGEPIEFEVYFKPTSTIKKEQNTVNKWGESVKLSVEGRHDPCVLPRAVPIVESLTALCLMDIILEQ